MSLSQCFLITEQEQVEVWMRGRDSGLRTPCRVYTPQGEEVLVELRLSGYSTHRVWLSGLKAQTFYYYELNHRPFQIINGGLAGQQGKSQESQPRKTLHLL